MSMLTCKRSIKPLYIQKYFSIVRVKTSAGILFQVAIKVLSFAICALAVIGGIICLVCLILAGVALCSGQKKTGKVEINSLIYHLHISK